MIGVTPDFMIIGAPKCGTTSLASWLGAHHRVLISSPKEPMYFSTDIVTHRTIASEAAYAALFAGAQPSQVTGEASTTYLRSERAVPAVLERRADTRFIVCLRNPVEMMPSVHMQLFRGGREDIADLSKAWDAQADRRRGRNLPSICPDASDLDYARVCALGSQVARLLDRVPRSQVLFVFNDDMRKDPRAVYLQVLNFIGIPDDGRERFEDHNTRRTPRSTTATRLVARASTLRTRLGLSGSFGLGALAAKLNDRAAVDGSAIDPAFRARLLAHFADEIRLLQEKTGRDLSHWLG